MHLLKSIRVVIAIESTEYQQNAFALLAAKHVVIRVALWFHRLFKRIGVSHLFVMLYGMKEFVGLVFPKTTAPVLGMGVFGNEVKHVEYLKNTLAPGMMENVRFKLLNPGGVLALLGLLLHPREVLRFLRFFRKLEKGMNFMPACRLAGSLMMYVRFRQHFAMHPPKAVAYASAYGPSACAVIAAAKAQGLKTVYIAHSLPSTSSRTFLKNHDLGVLESRAMSDRYRGAGMNIKHEVMRGILGKNIPMKLTELITNNYSVGIFLTGFSHVDAVIRLIQKLRTFTSAPIVVRGHPVDFSNPDMDEIATISEAIIISRGQKIINDLERCDVVVAGNTTAILEVLKHGVPVAYVGGLDRVRYDYNGLVKDGLVPGYENSESLDMQQVIAFYSDSGWAERFSYFDGAYGLTQEEVRQNVRNAVDRLID